MYRIKTLVFSLCLLVVGAAVGSIPEDQKKQSATETLVTMDAFKVAEIYTAKLGVKELTGKNDGPFIDQVLQVTGLDNKAWLKQTGKGYDWCAAFISWAFQEANVVAIKNAWAPSWFPPGKTIFEQGSKIKNTTPQKADVFGLWYPHMGLIGHVGFIDEWPERGDHFITVEGNWGGQVSRVTRAKSTAYKVSRWVPTINPLNAPKAEQKPSLS